MDGSTRARPSLAGKPTESSQRVELLPKSRATALRGTVRRASATGCRLSRRRHGVGGTGQDGTWRDSGATPDERAAAPALGPAVESDDVRRVLRGPDGRGGIAPRGRALGP